LRQPRTAQERCVPARMEDGLQPPRIIKFFQANEVLRRDRGIPDCAVRPIARSTPVRRQRQPQTNIRTCENPRIQSLLTDVSRLRSYRCTIIVPITSNGVQRTRCKPDDRHGSHRCRGIWPSFYTGRHLCVRRGMVPSLRAHFLVVPSHSALIGTAWASAFRRARPLRGQPSQTDEGHPA
jgi:hypothetical protein